MKNKSQLYLFYWYALVREKWIEYIYKKYWTRPDSSVRKYWPASNTFEGSCREIDSKSRVPGFEPL